jgi:hypothetical protein
LNLTDTLVTFGDSWPYGTGLKETIESPFGKIIAESLQIENYVNCAIPATSNDRTVLELLKYVNERSSVKNHLAVFFITTPTRKLAIQYDDKLIDINLNFTDMRETKNQDTIDKIYYKHLYSLQQEQFDLQRNMLSLQRVCSCLEIQDFYVIGWSDLNIDCPGVDTKKIYHQTCAQILGYKNQVDYTANPPNQFILPCGHPNQKGHALIADTLSQWIQTYER